MKHTHSFKIILYERFRSANV